MNLAGMDVELTGFEPAVMETLKKLEEADFCARLWEKDPALWKMDQVEQKIIANAMGWLDSPLKIRKVVPDLNEFAAELKKAGFRHVFLMGMGGSILAPLVFRETFGRHAPGLPLTVLDTTDPATVIRLERHSARAKRSSCQHFFHRGRQVRYHCRKPFFRRVFF
ncbi:hypothetical protein SBDP2_600009 [Syntrophobacter sp. SbD2]|nr:hypothetical protein SBDP2_600009 [Syntrophobacter sp. SbD2]